MINHYNVSLHVLNKRGMEMYTNKNSVSINVSVRFNYNWLLKP